MKAPHNAWVAAQLRELAARLELDDVPHRPRAYRRAADSIERWRRPVAEILAQEGEAALERLPGVGPRIASVVHELVADGEIAELERLRRATPVDVMGLLAVDGIGRKTLKLLWEELGVRSRDDLARALGDGRVKALPGFGARRAERIRQALRIQQRDGERMPRDEAQAIARRLRDGLAAQPGVVACEIAGSLRRGVATVGDIDLVAAADDPETAAAWLLDLPEVEHVYSRGPRRVSVRIAAGIDVDLRTVAPRCLGSALLYFTGSRAHTLALRRLALAQGLRLNEYGLFRDGERIAGETERELYAALSLPYLPPAERRGEAEIRDALRKVYTASS